jgi:hypothetical protein
MKQHNRLLLVEQAFLSVEQCAPADLLRSLQTQLSGSICGIPPGLCNDEYVTATRGPGLGGAGRRGAG